MAAAERNKPLKHTGRVLRISQGFLEEGLANGTIKHTGIIHDKRVFYLQSLHYIERGVKDGWVILYELK